MSRSSPIYLVGMMGVGKSTVGTLLASRLGRPFVDTDQEVERAAGRTIAEIFESDGELHFRTLEAEAIRAASADAAVVALGGGAAAEPGAMERLLATGEVVYLMADPELLVQRIADPASRPLLAGLDLDGQIERLQRLLADRKPFYDKARVRIDARGSAEEVVERIIDGLAARAE